VGYRCPVKGSKIDGHTACVRGGGEAWIGTGGNNLERQQVTVCLVGFHKDVHHELADGELLISGRGGQEIDVISFQKRAITRICMGIQGWTFVSCHYKADGCSGPRTMKSHILRLEA